MKLLKLIAIIKYLLLYNTVSGNNVHREYSIILQQDIKVAYQMVIIQKNYELKWFNTWYTIGDFEKRRYYLIYLDKYK